MYLFLIYIYIFSKWSKGFHDMGELTFKPSHRMALAVPNLCRADSAICVFLSISVCSSSKFDQSAFLRSSYEISTTTQKGKEGHILQEVRKGHTVYLFRYIAFHGSQRSSPSAFTSLYAFPGYTSLIT